MKILFTTLVLLLCTGITHSQQRVVIMADFPPVDVIPGGMGFGDPEKRSDSDDMQSMVRLLLYANEFDIEGLIASSATFANIANKQNILDVLYLYDRVCANLISKDPRYPKASQLRDVTWQGRSGTWGHKVEDIIGKGCDSEASEKIIELLDKSDDRAVWFCIWGGSCDLAQALWKIKHTRQQTDIERIISKVRVYMIGLQDGSGQWLLDTFPQMKIIVSKGNYMGMFNNATDSDSSLSDLRWVNMNIRKGHGILGAIYPESGFYPETPGVWEGDSPSFLYLVSAAKGISSSEDPSQDSWGGSFIRPDTTKDHWFDSPEGTQAVSKWRKQVQEDFAMRADMMLP